MSNHDSDMEDAASDRSDSPEQSESGDHLLPKNNPSNIANDAEISDSRNAKRPTKKPKMAGRTPIPQDDYAELQGEPNIDSRADGGFINPGNARARDRRMRWDAAADRELLIFGFGREIRTEEYKILAERFEQKPTVKAIQERITKLRVEVRRVLKETGIFDPERVAQPPPRGPATPGQGMSSPAQQSAKKAKKDRPASGGPKPKGDTLPPGTGSPAPRSQQGFPSAQPPSANPPPGHAWGTHHPPGRPATANMYGPFGPPPQNPGSQMGMLPSGASLDRLYGGIPQSLFYGPAGIGMGGHQQQQQHQLPSFTGGAFTPSLPSQQPGGADTNPPGEEEDPLARSERELKEKRAKREARKKDFQPPK